MCRELVRSAREKLQKKEVQPQVEERKPRMREEVKKSLVDRTTESVKRANQQLIKDF
jgi:hypothetical protein